MFNRKIKNRLDEFEYLGSSCGSIIIKYYLYASHTKSLSLLSFL